MIIMLAVREEVVPVQDKHVTYDVLSCLYTILLREIRSRSVYELCWSVRTSNFFLQQRIKTIGDLIDFDLTKVSMEVSPRIRREVFDMCLAVFGFELTQWKDTAWKKLFKEGRGPYGKYMSIR